MTVIVMAIIVYRIAVKKRKSKPRPSEDEHQYVVVLSAKKAVTNNCTSDVNMEKNNAYGAIKSKV